MSNYVIGQIVSLNEYTDAVLWCDENNATLVELEPNEGQRRFQITELKPYTPTHEDIRRARVDYRREHIDDETNNRTRSLANGSWTEEKEQAYLELDRQVTAWIEENLPYPTESEN